MCLQKTACVDFSFNPLCDRKFKFYDGSLVEAVKLEDSAVQEFFRLLALCHTVMPEEKTEGKLHTQASRTSQTRNECFLIDVSVNMKEIWCTRPSHLTRERWSLQHETLGLSSGPEPQRPSHCVKWDKLSPTSSWLYWTSTTCAREWVSLVRSSFITASVVNMTLWAHE